MNVVFPEPRNPVMRSIFTISVLLPSTRSDIPSFSLLLFPVRYPFYVSCLLLRATPQGTCPTRLNYHLTLSFTVNHTFIIAIIRPAARFSPLSFTNRTSLRSRGMNFRSQLTSSHIRSFFRNSRSVSFFRKINSAASIRMLIPEQTTDGCV